MPHGYGTCNMPLVLLKSLVYNSTGSSSKIFSENLLYLHIIINFAGSEFFTEFY